MATETTPLQRMEEAAKNYEEIRQTTTLLEHAALVIAGVAHVTRCVPADPKDEMFLACALGGQAYAIVSIEHHLLDLGAYRNIPTITARQFLERLNPG